MERSQKDLDLFLASIESKLRGPFSSLDLTKTIQTPALRDPLTRHQYLQRIQAVMGKTDKITQSRIVIALLGLLDPDPSNSYNGGRGPLKDDDNDDDVEGEGALDHDIYAILQQAQEAPTYEEWVRICSSLVQGIMYEDGGGDDSDNNNDTNNHNGTSRSLMGEEARKLLDKTTNDIIKRVIDVERSTEYEEDDPNYVPSDKADADPIALAPYRYALLNPDLLDRVVPDVQSACPHFAVNAHAEVLRLDARLEKAKADEERDHEAKQGTGALLQQHGAASASLATSANGSGGGTAPQASRPAAVLPGAHRTGAAKPSTSAATNARPKSSMFVPAKKPAQIVAAKAGKTILHARKAGAAQALLMKGRGGGGKGAAAGAAGRARVAPTNSAGPAGASSGGASGVGGNTGAAPPTVQRAAPGANRTLLPVGKGRAAALLGQRPPPQLRAPGSAKSKMVMMDVSEVADLTLQREQQQQSTTTHPSAAAQTGKRKAAGSHDDAPSRPGKLSKKGSASASSSLKAPPAAQHKEATSAAPPVAAHPSPSGDQDAGGGAGALASAALTAYLAQQQQQQLQKLPPAEVARQPPSNGTGMGGGAGGGAASGATGGGGLDWKDMLRQRSNRLSDDDRRRIQLFFVDQARPTLDDGGGDGGGGGGGEPIHRIKLHEERAVDSATGLPIKETYYLELDYSTFTSRQSKKIKRYKEGQ